jgi:hypothetical protein
MPRQTVATMRSESGEDEPGQGWEPRASAYVSHHLHSKREHEGPYNDQRKGVQEQLCVAEMPINLSAAIVD